MSRDSGRRIGDYEALELIGSGSQGRVWLARYEGEPREGLATGQRVAIKVCHPIHEESDFDRFRKNIDRLKLLRHPNIVEYIESFLWDDGWQQSPCLVMEYLEGRSLQEVLREHPRGLPWTQAQSLFRQFLQALIHARERGIIHRDIKPANIFVFPDGRLKLIDFGVARREGASHSSTAGWRGTFDYMAPDFVYDPERLENFRGDECSDVFSAAAVFYELLTGRPPFKPLGESGPAGYMSRWRKGAEPKLTLSHGLFRVLAHAGSFVRKGLAPARADRFQTFVEMRDAFLAIKPKILRVGGEDAYEFLEYIGKGGFGAVYKAVDLRNGGIVAVKQLTLTNQSKRFLREARLLKQYRHPNLVRFHDFIHVPARDEYYLIMECLPGIPGWSLRDRLRGKEGGAIRLAEAISLFDGYLQALGYLHGQGVIHRDIKPSNLYAPPDHPEMGKLFDMGIARDQRGTQTAGQIPGTFDYMAPEFVLQAGIRGDEQTDLYSLGIVLYEAVTGERAYPRLPSSPRDAYLEMQKRATEGQEVPTDHPVFDECPMLRQIIQMATARDRKARYRSAEAMREDLRRALAWLNGDVPPVEKEDDDEVTPVMTDVETEVGSELLETAPDHGKEGAGRKEAPEELPDTPADGRDVVEQVDVDKAVTHTGETVFREDPPPEEEAHQAEPDTGVTVFKESHPAADEQKMAEKAPDAVGAKPARRIRRRGRWAVAAMAAGVLILVAAGVLWVLSSRDGDILRMERAVEQLMRKPEGTAAYVSNLVYWIEFGRERREASPIYRYWIRELTELGDDQLIALFKTRFDASSTGDERRVVLEEWESIELYATHFAWGTDGHQQQLDAMRRVLERGRYEEILGEFNRIMPAESGVEVVRGADEATAVYLEFRAERFAGVDPEEKQRDEAGMRAALREFMEEVAVNAERDPELASDYLARFTSYARTLRVEFTDEWGRLQARLEEIHRAVQEHEAEQRIAQYEVRLARADDAWSVAALKQEIGRDRVLVDAHERGDDRLGVLLEAINRRVGELARGVESDVRVLLDEQRTHDARRENESLKRVIDAFPELGLTGALRRIYDELEQQIDAEAGRHEEARGEIRAEVQRLRGQIGRLRGVVGEEREEGLKRAVGQAAQFYQRYVGETAFAEESVRAAWRQVMQEIEGMIGDLIEQRDPAERRARRLERAGALIEQAGFLSDEKISALRARLERERGVYHVRIENRTGVELTVNLPDGRRERLAAGAGGGWGLEVVEERREQRIGLGGPDGYRPDPAEIVVRSERGGGFRYEVGTVQPLPVRLIRREMDIGDGHPPVEVRRFDAERGEWVALGTDIEPGRHRFRFARADYDPVQREEEVAPGIRVFTLNDPGEWRAGPALEMLRELERKVNLNEMESVKKLITELDEGSLQWPAYRERLGRIRLMVTAVEDEIDRAVERAERIRQRARDAGRARSAVEELKAFKRDTEEVVFNHARVQDALGGVRVVVLHIDSPRLDPPVLNVELTVSDDEDGWEVIHSGDEWLSGAYRLRATRPDYRPIERAIDLREERETIIVPGRDDWRPADGLLELMGMESELNEQEWEALEKRNELPNLDWEGHRDRLETVLDAWLKQLENKVDAYLEGLPTELIKQVVDPSATNIRLEYLEEVSQEGISRPIIPVLLSDRASHLEQKMNEAAEMVEAGGCLRSQAHAMYQQIHRRRILPGEPLRLLAEHAAGGGQLNEADVRLGAYATVRIAQECMDHLRREGVLARRNPQRQYGIDLGSRQERAEEVHAQLKAIIGQVDEQTRERFVRFLQEEGYEDRDGTRRVIAYLVTFHGERFPELGAIEIGGDLKREMNALKRLMENNLPYPGW